MNNVWIMNLPSMFEKVESGFRMDPDIKQKILVLKIVLKEKTNFQFWCLSLRKHLMMHHEILNNLCSICCHTLFIYLDSIYYSDQITGYISIRGKIASIKFRHGFVERPNAYISIMPLDSA